MRFLFRYLVKAALFIVVELFLGRFLGAVVGNLCTVVGVGLWEASCSIVRHAGIECVIDFVEQKRRQILDFSIGFAVLTVPIWVGAVLLWYHHPFFAWPTIIVGEFAMLVWAANLPDPKNPGSKPPSEGNGPAGPPPDTGTPSAMAPA